MRNGVGAALAVLAMSAMPAASGEVTPEEVEFTEALTVEQPLTAQRGRPFAGLEVFIDRKLGNCVACHTNFDVQAMQFLGNIGPSLDWVGDRLSPAQLRAILIDAKQVFGPETIMPAFYSTKGGYRTAEAFAGKPILTAQQIEDLVAYLGSLKKH